MQVPKTSTPVGSAAIAAAAANIILRLLDLWPWWHTVMRPVTDSVSTVLIFVLTYLAGWLSVVRSPHQAVHMQLTSTPLPTLQATDVQATPEHPLSMV